MDAEARLARKAAAKDRKYSSRYKPKQVGRSVFTIQQVQAKRAEQEKGGRVEKPSRLHTFFGGLCSHFSILKESFHERTMTGNEFQ